MKKILLVGIVFLLSIYMVSAVCTVTLDQDTYNPGGTATVTMSCSEQSEKNTAYTLNWTNATGYVVESDTGTTPSVAGTNFFESYTLASDYNTMYGTTLNATLFGTGLEGKDNATVAAAGTSDLVITNILTTTSPLLNKFFGIMFDIEDENGKKLSNAECALSIQSGGGFPIIDSKGIVTHDGEGHGSFYLEPDSVSEGTSYNMEIHCSCGLNNTAKACVDEDGLTVANSGGTAITSFSIGTWLTVNTVTGKSIYNMKDEIFICANVTNVGSSSRIPMHIYHQVRCSKGSDNDADLDRVLVVSDDETPDERGIGAGQTQMQCKRFIIPEPDFLQGTNSECYASTSVWVLNEERVEIVGYVTTSPVFNITSSELNIHPDWQRQSKYVFNSIINLSDTAYLRFNGSGIGQLDVKLESLGQFLRSYEQDSYAGYSLDSFYSTRYIKNITARNSTDLVGDYGIEFIDDGSIEIELRDVDITQNGWYNITMEFENFEERSTISLENISLKTGTFAFSISIPDQAQSPGTISVSTSAQVELGTGPIEGHFICYIDGYQSQTEVRWTHAVGTSSAYVDTKTITVPSGLTGANSVVCKAGEASFTNLIHTSSDVFTAITEPGTGGAAGGEGTTPERRYGESRKLTDLAEPTFTNLIFLGVGICFLIIMAKRREEDEETK